MKTCLIILFIILLVLVLTESRGGRGGGFRGGRSYRSSRSYRSGSRSRYVSKYRSSRLNSKSQIRTAILVGTIYGATRWKTRRSYRSHGKLPEVCYNDRYEKYGNISTLGRFVCPLDSSMSDDYNYCCGEEGRQYCCTFWDDGGRTAGVVIGILIAAVAIFVLIFCCIKRRKAFHGKVFRRTPYAESKHQGYSEQSAPLKAQYADPPMPMTTPYTAQPAMNVYPPPQNPPGPPPYDASTGGLPYDVNPAGHMPYSVNPPPINYGVNQQTPAYLEKSPVPGNAYDASNGQLPYPTNPTYPPSGPNYGMTPYPPSNSPYPPQ